MADKEARSIVLIIDTSASMKTKDIHPDTHDDKKRTTRIQAAKEKAKELLSNLGNGDSLMLFRMDGQVTPISRFETDKALLKKEIDKISANDTPANLRRALRSASDSLRARKNPMIIIIGDGAYPEHVLEDIHLSGDPKGVDPGVEKGSKREQFSLSAIDLGTIDLRFIPIGETSSNVGIIGFNVRRYLANKSEYEVFIEIQNFSDTVMKRRLQIYSADPETQRKKTKKDEKEWGEVIFSDSIELEPGERLRRIYPRLGGLVTNQLTARLTATANEEDLFDLDDTAYALLPEYQNPKILLVTQDHLLLEAAVLIHEFEENKQPDKLTPSQYEEAISSSKLRQYDIIIFDSFAPERVPPAPTNLIYFGPQGKHSPFPIASVVKRPRIDAINKNHPVMKWLVLSDVNFDKATIFRPTQGDFILASYARAPLIIAKKENGRKVIALGFDLLGTDMVLRVAFPLFFINAFDWFAGTNSELMTTYASGTRVHVAVDENIEQGEATITPPTGNTIPAPIQHGVATFYTSQIGVHGLSVKEEGKSTNSTAGNSMDPLRTIAINLSNVNESQITPNFPLLIGGKEVPAPPEFHFSPRRSIWVYLVFAILLLLFVEWGTYHRRITI